MSAPSLPQTDPTLHVLLTADVVGGVWDFCCSLARSYRERGHRVTLLVFGEPNATHRDQAADAGAWLLAQALKLEWMQDSQADVQAAVKLTRRVVRELEPDVVHANQFALGSARLAVPVVVTAHSDVLSWRACISGDRTTPPEWAGYAALVREGISGAAAALAISQFLADELRDLYRLERPLQVVHNGWRAADGPLMPIPLRGRSTLVAGRVWDEAKNLRVVAEVAASWPDAGEVCLAGEQRHPESGGAPDLPSALKTLGFVPRERLDGLLRQTRVYLSPARYDPFGLLPLQAALAGCALLLADIPSYRELWDGVALFFPPDDPAALRRQWGRLLEDDALTVPMAAAARARALERYSAAKQADQYLALYRSLLLRDRGTSAVRRLVA